jgi:LPS export ABC transporter permease LptG/LPS export ABC transporter permease LptF
MIRIRIRTTNGFRPKLFDRYILREFLPPFGLGLLVYSFVLLANQILQYPELFIAQGVSFADSTKLLLYFIPAVLAFTLPMAVIMGILAGLSRLSSDSESVAFKSLGVSHARMGRPLAVFAAFGWAATLVLTLYVTPYFNYLWLQTAAGAALEKTQIKVNPREFNTSVPDIALFLEDMDRNGEWKNVFIAFAGGPYQSQVALARRGRLNYSTETKRATVELFDAVQHNSILDEPKLYERITSVHVEREIDMSAISGTFSVEKKAREQNIDELTAGLAAARSEISRLEAAKAALSRRGLAPNHPDRAKTDNALLLEARKIRTLLVERHKRFALPFVCWIFVFLGLPLGLSTKKGGRTSGFTLSLVIILAYYVFLTFGEKLAVDGRVSPWLGLWGGNIVFGAASIFLFIRSARERPLFQKWFRRPLPKVETETPAASSPIESRAGARRFRLVPPVPGILDRYFIRRYVLIGGLIIVSVVSIFAVVTFFDKLGNVYSHNKPLSMLFDYIYYRLPEFLQLGLPMTALLATMLTLGLFQKFNEITAMKACGISVFRMIAPAFVLAAVIGGLSFRLQENILPGSSQKAVEVWERINDVPPRGSGVQGRSWVTNKARDRFFHYDYFDPATLTFGKLSIFEMDSARWSIRRRHFAERARLDGGMLRLEGGWSRDFPDAEISPPPAPSFFAALDISIPEGRGLFLDETKDPSRMNYAELGRYIGEVERLGFDTTRLRVDRSSKISFPFVAVIMTLLGIPFAFAMGKKGALVGVGVGLGVALVFWTAIGVFKSLGAVGILPVFLAAWGPPLLFGIGGLFLMVRLKT